MYGVTQSPSSSSVPAVPPEPTIGLFPNEFPPFVDL